MYDGIEYRGASQQVVEDLAKYAGVPVWNGLTDDWHPTQMLADFLTIQENFGRLSGIFGVSWDGVIMSRIHCWSPAPFRGQCAYCCPQALQPAAKVQALAAEKALVSGAQQITDDIAAGVAGVDVLYTDVWASMGKKTALPRVLSCWHLTKLIRHFS